jgi:hypothetical protein
MQKDSESTKRFGRRETHCDGLTRYRTTARQINYELETLLCRSKPLIQLLCGWTPNEEGSRENTNGWHGNNKAMIDACNASPTPHNLPTTGRTKSPAPSPESKKKGRFQAESREPLASPDSPSPCASLVVRVGSSVNPGWVAHELPVRLSFLARLHLLPTVTPDSRSSN